MVLLIILGLLLRNLGMIFLGTNQQIMLEARRYLIAQMQSITYREFLPAILPKSDMIKYQLGTDSTSQYDEDSPSAIYVEFSTAAFR